MASPLSTRLRLGLAAGALATITTLALAGCTPGGYPDSTGQAEQQQSVEEACEIVSDEVEAAVEGLQGAAQDDPDVAVEAMRSAADALGQAAPRITNQEIGALVPQMEELFSQLGDVAEAVLVDGDASQAESLQSLATEFESTLGDYQELCGTN